MFLPFSCHISRPAHLPSFNHRHGINYEAPHDAGFSNLLVSCALINLLLSLGHGLA